MDYRELQFLFHRQNLLLRECLAFDGCLQVKNWNVLLRNGHAIPHDEFLCLDFLVALLALGSIMIIQFWARQSIQRLDTWLQRLPLLRQVELNSIVRQLCVRQTLC